MRGEVRAGRREGVGKRRRCKVAACRGVARLVVGRARVGAVLHGLGPGGEQLLGAVGLVEVCDGAANVGRVPVGHVGLVGPEVEERDVTRTIGPRVVEEELGERVELEVDVEEDDGLLRLVHLVEEEEGL
eukprot:scaffold76689_cov60-Phaeocystis_antarctica.AAC.3